MTFEDAIAFNDRLAVRLPPAPLFVLCVLVDRLGRTQSHGAIADWVFDLSGQRPTTEAIRSSVRNLRRAGVTVETDQGLGYRMDAMPAMKAFTSPP